jgi:hypothetical protein
MSSSRTRKPPRSEAATRGTGARTRTDGRKRGQPATTRASRTLDVDAVRAAFSVLPTGVADEEQ